MFKYFATRTLLLGLTLFVAGLIIFSLLNILPGDPARFMLGINASELAVENLRAQLNLNDPFIVRFFDWFFGFFTGDFGTSFSQKLPVSELIFERLAVSFPLTIMALIFALIIGFPVGFWAAHHHQRPLDSILMIGAQTGMAVPNFWLAMILVTPLALWWGLVPSGGFSGWNNGIFGALNSLLLPAFALSVPQAAILARIFRTSLIEVKSQDYMRTARAKGLGKRDALWRHGIRNALIPVMTILGLQFAFLIAGTIIIEEVFFLPGLGRLIFTAIKERDLITVQSCVLFLVIAVILINYIIDLIFAYLDPRMSASSKRHI